MGKLAIVSEETVRKIVTRQLAFDAVRAAFEAVAVERSRVFDVVIGTGLHKDEAFAIKSGQLVDKLIELNKTFSFMIYPARSHSIDEKANTKRHLMTDFLHEKLPASPAIEP